MDSDGLTLLERTTRLPSPLGAAALRVGWVGTAPSWLRNGGGRALESVELEWLSLSALLALNGLSSSLPMVLHVPDAKLDVLRSLRHAAAESALVLDLTGVDEFPLRRRTTRRMALADLVLVGSLSDLRELRRRHPFLALRTALMRPPIDLDAHAPEALLRRSRGWELARLRQAHGLDGRVVLFAGPFTADSGLDVAVAAVAELRERISGLRLAAVPQGKVDSRYVARVREQADSVGVRIAEGRAGAGESPLWYALSTVVCLPSRMPVGGEPARLAAAAGRPFVGSEIDPLFEHVVEGETGYLVPPGDVERLVATLERMLRNDDERRRLGEAARRKAEGEFGVGTAMRRLVQLWTKAAEGRSIDGARLAGD